MTPAQALEAAKVHIDNHLHEICEAMIAWDENSVRPDSILVLSELFRLCSYADIHAVRVAKQLIYDAAIRQIVKARWDY